MEPTPPPIPTTPRPRPPVVPNEDPPLPARPSPKPHSSHSHFRSLPTPPPVNRTKEKEFGGHSNSKPTESPPLPPNRPDVPLTENHSKLSSSSFSKPPPPRRPHLPKSKQPSPPTLSDRQQNKPPIPRRPSNISPSSSVSPPPPPPNKPTLNRGSIRPLNIDLTPSGTVQDMMATLQKCVPDILTAMQDKHTRVPQALEDLANLVESIVDTAQTTPCTKTIAFRKVVASLRGDFSTLRDYKGPLWQRNEEKVTQCVQDLVQNVSLLSSHLN